MRLGYTLVKLGFVEETEISKMLARQYRMPAVDLSRFEVDPKIIKLIPPDVAIKHTVLPSSARAGPSRSRSPTRTTSPRSRTSSSLRAATCFR